MIDIEKTNSVYILDLNNSNEKNYYLTIDSRDDNGKIIPWAVYFVSNDTIKYHEEGVDKLSLTFDLSSIKNSEYVVLENYKKEKAKIIIRPNLKESLERKYEFRIYQYDILNNNTIKFMVKSESDFDFVNWKCSYDGKPLSYKIDVQKQYIIIEFKSIVFKDTVGHIILEQEISHKNINIQLLHHKDGKLKVLRIY